MENVNTQHGHKTLICESHCLADSEELRLTDSAATTRRRFIINNTDLSASSIDNRSYEVMTLMPVHSHSVLTQRTRNCGSFSTTAPAVSLVFPVSTRTCSSSSAIVELL